MRTVEYLDAIQAKYALPSDYAISKKLNITRTAVSHYRGGKGYFSDEIAQRAAELLGIHPGIVMLDMYTERANDSKTRSVWQDIQAGFHVPLLKANRVRRGIPLPR